MSIRVVIVDDQALVRTGFRMILEETGDMDVVGEAADGNEVIDLVRSTHPDVVLMDVRMPGMDGVAATQSICGEDSAPRIIILTTYDLDEYVYAGLRAGASGFLLKDALAGELVAAIRTVASGEAVLAPTAVKRIVERFIEHVPHDQSVRDEKLHALTSREREILGLVAKGLSNREIAERLYVGEGTVKTHVGHVLSKLDLRDRVQAVVLAYETGLVRAGSS